MIHLKRKKKENNSTFNKTTNVINIIKRSVQKIKLKSNGHFCLFVVVFSNYSTFNKNLHQNNSEN